MHVLPAQVITNDGKSVPPEEVSFRTQDPKATADYFQEGVHYVPDTEEFLEAIGHWATSDADLIGRRWGAAASRNPACLHAEGPHVLSTQHAQGGGAQLDAAGGLRGLRGGRVR